MINKRFLYYKKLDTFRNDLNEGIIDRESIGFIEDANLIWTHDVYFGSNGTAFTIDNTLSTTSENAVLNKVITAELNTVKNNIQGNYYTKEELDEIFSINGETLRVIQQLVESLNQSSGSETGDDGQSNNLQALFDAIANKADKSQVEELENTLLNDYYNQTLSNSIFMTKDEFDEYLNPVSVSISINPSNTVEYTGEDYPVTITYRVLRKNVLNTPDSVVVKLDNNTIYAGTDATKTISATVKTAIKHTASVSATKGGKTINASASKHIVHPTYMFFDKSSSKEGITLPSQKYLYTSLNASGIEINNNEDGNYLWIVTPYTLNKITTDAGRSYPVEMSDEGIIGNHKYYRSVLQVDKSNIRYWIN